MSTEQQQKRGPGRPPKNPEDGGDGLSPEDRARNNLQYAMDRANSFICDHPTTSFVARAARAARIGIPRETVDKALDAMEAALADARRGVERAYAAPQKAASAQPRVVL